MKNKFLVSLISLLIIMLTVVPASASVDTTAAGEDTLQASMEYLVNHIGQRLAGTPNETMAAAYVQEKFEEFGYENVVWHNDISRSAVSTGMLAFNGSGAILGTPYPNTTAFPRVEGKLVDLGTYPDVTVPVGITGDIVGAVRFEAALNTANIAQMVTALEEQYNVKVNGLLVARAGAYYTAQSISGSTSIVPTVSTPVYFLERAVAKAEDFTHMERYTSSATNAVVATKPAPGGDPDLIIVVSSHMDSVLNSPGASDNASGTAVNIELARRLANVDLGNIEVRFAVVGSEESGGMAGSVFVATQLNNEGKQAIAINLNMDMVCAIGKTSNGRTLDAVSMDINPSPLAFNLPAYLVTDEAKTVDWADEIENVRIYRYGSSDHVQFANRGVEAGSMIIVTDDTDDIEVQDHNSRDNLEENYGYDRISMCANLMENAVLKAARQEISKRAKLSVNEKENTVALLNAEQLFKTFNTVNVSFGTDTITFVKGEKTTLAIPGTSFEVTAVNAKGTGNADNKNVARNDQYKNFVTTMVAEIVPPDSLVINADAGLLIEGEDFEVSTGFNKIIQSNTIVLDYAFDTSKFAFKGFNTADGVDVISASANDTGAKVMLMVKDYQAKDFGKLVLTVTGDLERSDQEIGLNATYVTFEEDKKVIKNLSGNTTVWGYNPPTEFTLIDLSNAIDCFGKTSEDPEWNTLYRFWDFNGETGVIDIGDISYVAKLVK